MRISDWSSDVCSSDLEATVSVTCSALSGQAATCTRLTRRRSVRMTPGSSAPRWTTRASLWPRSGDMASSKLTDSLGVEEVGRHHLDGDVDVLQGVGGDQVLRSEEHTAELQSLMRISYAVFCLKKK